MLIKLYIFLSIMYIFFLKDLCGFLKLNFGVGQGLKSLLKVPKIIFEVIIRGIEVPNRLNKNVHIFVKNVIFFLRI